MLLRPVQGAGGSPDQPAKRRRRKRKEVLEDEPMAEGGRKEVRRQGSSKILRGNFKENLTGGDREKRQRISNLFLSKKTEAATGETSRRWDQEKNIKSSRETEKGQEEKGKKEWKSQEMKILAKVTRTWP